MEFIAFSIILGLVTVSAIVFAEIRVRRNEKFLTIILAIERKPERADAIIQEPAKNNGAEVKKRAKPRHI
jgi:hypothetical protein